MLLRRAGGRGARCSPRRGGHRHLRPWRRPAAPGRRRAGVVCAWRFAIRVFGMGRGVAEERVHRIDYNGHISSSMDSGAGICHQTSQHIAVFPYITGIVVARGELGACRKLSHSTMPCGMVTRAVHVIVPSYRRKCEIVCGGRYNGRRRSRYVWQHIRGGLGTIVGGPERC